MAIFCNSILLLHSIYFTYQEISASIKEQGCLEHPLLKQKWEERGDGGKSVCWRETEEADE